VSDQSDRGDAGKRVVLQPIPIPPRPLSVQMMQGFPEKIIRMVLLY